MTVIKTDDLVFAMQVAADAFRKQRNNRAANRIESLIESDVEIEYIAGALNALLAKAA